MPEPEPTVKRQPSELFLLIYKSPLFKVHWALFIEHKEHCHRPPPNQNTGTLIQVNGDVRAGFYFEVDKGHSPKMTSRITEMLRLGSIKPSSSDDDIIALAEKIQPPSRSLRSSQSVTLYLHIIISLLREVLMFV